MASYNVTKNLLLTYFLVTIGASFQFGFQTGVMNSVLPLLKEFINETSHFRGVSATSGYVLIISSLMVAAFPIGGIGGSLLGAYVANRLGRRGGLFFFAFPTLVGSLLMMSSKVMKTYEAVIIGRLIIGVSCGAYTGIAPMMLSELAPVQIRGASGIVNQLVIVASLLLSQLLALPSAMGTTERWCYLLGFSFFPCLIQLIALPIVPETPSYLLLNRGDQVSAKSALRWLRGPDEAEIESELRSMSADTVENKLKLSDVIRLRYFQLAIGVAITCHLSQQLSGINAVLNYSTSFFLKAGLTALQASWATVGVSLVNLAVTIVSIFLVDRVGRRSLLLGGLSVMAVNGILLSAFIIPRGGHVLNYLSIGSVCLFVAGFAIGPGSIPWFIVSELFTYETRDAAMAISVVVNWLAQIAILFIYPVMLEHMRVLSFVPFVVLLVVFIGVLYGTLPETKGRAPAEMEFLFKRRVGDLPSDGPEAHLVAD